MGKDEEEGDEVVNCRKVIRLYQCQVKTLPEEANMQQHKLVKVLNSPPKHTHTHTHTQRKQVKLHFFSFYLLPIHTSTFPQMLTKLIKKITEIKKKKKKVKLTQLLTNKSLKNKDFIPSPMYRRYIKILVIEKQ